MKKLIKIFTGLGALAILIIGLALLGLTIYGYINSSIFLGDQDTKNLVLGIMLAVSLAIVGGAAEGIYGICAQKSKLVCIFQIIVIFFMLIFLGIGVGLLILPGEFFNGDCATSTNSLIQYADKIYVTSQQNYCISCSCALDNSEAYLNRTYSTEQIDFINKTYTGISPSGARSTEECLRNNGTLTPPEIALFQVIKQLENFLDCSNWCENTADPFGNLIYRFNDINGGKPLNYCYPKLNETFRDYNYYGKICFFVGGGILLLMFICNMYMCCCNESSKNKNYKERFMYMESEQRREEYQQPRYRRQMN